MTPQRKTDLVQQALLAIGLGLLALALGSNLYADHRNIDHRERQRLADQARIIDDNLARQLAAVNRALVSLQEGVPELLREPDGLRHLGLRLGALSGAMPGVRTLFVMDRDGRILASSRASLVGQLLDVRAYFQLARQSNDPAVLHVSSPIRNALGTFAINLERSMRDGRGRFAGLVAATLDPEYFTTLFDSVIYAPDMWASLVHGDGTLFISVPPQAFPPGSNLAMPDSLFSRHVASGETATVLTGPLVTSGVMRMVARRTMRPEALAMDAALFVGVTRDLGALFDPWRRDLKRQLLLFALMAGGAWWSLLAHQRRQHLAARLTTIREGLERDSEIQMRLFFDRQVVGMAITSPERGWVKVNDRLCRMLGYTRDELLTMTWSELTHPDDLPKSQDEFGRLLAGEQDEYATEKRYLRKDGSVLFTELSIACVRNPDGTVDRVLAVLADSTERRRHQDVLRRIMREQEIILESANVGISLMVGRQQVWVNHWMEATFQYSKREMEGQTTRMLYPDQERYEGLGAAAYPALARGEGYDTVQQLVRRDGTLVWIKYNGKAIDPADLDQGSLWILTDVTAQKAAEDALRESEARFRTLFEAHSAMMLLVDPDGGRIEDVNPAAAAFYGYPREAMTGLSITELNTAPRDEVFAELRQAVGRVNNTFAFQHRLADGGVRMVEVNSSPVRIGGRTLLFSIVADTTERTQHQADLEALNRTLADRVQQAVTELRAKDQMLITQSRQAALGEMISNIAHQWRQPLNALGLILVNLQDARRFRELDEASFARALVKADQLIQGMSMTINDFRDFFRPDKARVKFSALAQVRIAVGLVEATFQALGIEIVVDPGGDCQLHGLPSEYAQVLLNLLSNAKQAIQDTGRAQGRISLALEAQDGFGCLRVRDDGWGIAEDILERIFEPYFSTRAQGTGIGLYMCRQILEQSMNGRILARNTDDGAEFSVLVPLAGEAP